MLIFQVRDVSSSGPDTIVSIEEKGRAGIFIRVGPSDWHRQESSDPQEQRIHNALAFVIANVEGCKMKGEARASGHGQQYYPKGTFMTGGGDKAARPFTAHGTSFNALTDHNGPVNSISYTHPDRFVLTGSWDGIVRMWNGDECIQKFDKLGHEHGTEVIGLENGTIVTASTNKTIVIIDHSGKILHRVPNAHSAPIRKLIPHPLGFASAGNDGIVNVWTADGQLVQTIEAATNSEVKFLYGLAFLSGGNPLAAGVNLDATRLLTCGEDGYVRMFDASGRKVQEFIHPGPVRSVQPLGSDGDFITACTDKKVRIFTRDPTRYATVKERNEFKEIGELVQSQGMKSLDTNTLEGEEALQKPGTKNGQVKVLNIKGRPVPIAYQWSDDLGEWIEIGEAMGSTGTNGPTKAKSKLDGVEYDFVSDVWLDESHKVQLGFNADDDPEEVTNRFCALYQIPADMRQQILDFVIPKVDMAAVIRKKEEAAAAASAPKIVLHQVPSWSSGSFETYAQANIQAMEKKITETNSLLASQGHASAITNSEELKNFRALFDTIRDVTSYHSSPFSASELTVFRKFLHWPTEHILPIMDAFRVLMMHHQANQSMGGDEQLHQLLFDHVKAGKAAGKDTHQILMLKIVANWIAKRQRASSERSEPASVPEPVLNYIKRTLNELSDAAQSENENLALAYVMLLHK